MQPCKSRSFQSHRLQGIWRIILTSTFKAWTTLGSRSIRRPYINAMRLFRCATVITPVIFLLRGYLGGPHCWMMYHLSTVKSPAPPSRSLSPHLGTAAQRCTGVAAYKNATAHSLCFPLYLRSALSGHPSSPLCHISLEAGSAGVDSARQAAGGLGLVTSTVLSLSPRGPTESWDMSFSAHLTQLWPGFFFFFFFNALANHITCQCLLYFQTSVTSIANDSSPRYLSISHLKAKEKNISLPSNFGYSKLFVISIQCREYVLNICLKLTYCISTQRDNECSLPTVCG